MPLEMLQKVVASLTCACGKPLVGRTCGSKECVSKRQHHHSGRPMEFGPGLHSMRAKAGPSRCPFCRKDLVENRTGRKAKTCGAKECLTAYQKHYRRDYRRARSIYS